MSKPIKITLFHADWCGHCHSFMPTWKGMISDKLANENILFEEYESGSMDTLSKKDRTINGRSIEGFPTIKIAINDNEFEYSGDRTPSGIYSFILKKLKHILSSSQYGGTIRNNSTKLRQLGRKIKGDELPITRI